MLDNYLVTKCNLPMNDQHFISPGKNNDHLFINNFLRLF